MTVVTKRLPNVTYEVDVSGSGNVVPVSDYSIVLLAGVSNTTIVGSRNKIDAATGINFSVTGTQNTIKASSDAIWLNSGVSKTTIVGSGNTINAASGINFGVTGSNHLLYASSDTISLNPGVRNTLIIGNGDIVNSVASGGGGKNNEFVVLGDNNTINAAPSDGVYLLGGKNDTVYGNLFSLRVGSNMTASVKGGGNGIVLGTNTTLKFLPGSSTGVISLDPGGYDTIVGPSSVFQYATVHGFSNSDAFVISDLSFSSKLKLTSKYMPNSNGSWPWEELVLSNPDAKSASNPTGMLAYFRIVNHVKDAFEVYANPSGGIRIDVGNVSNAIHVV